MGLFRPVTGLLYLLHYRVKPEMDAGFYAIKIHLGLPCGDTIK
jgi:hypothetical protein